MAKYVNKLLTVLHRIVADDKPFGHNFIKSGNITNKLRELETEKVLELVDAYYEKTAKEKEVSEKTYLLGRLNKTKKPVYRIEIPPNVLFLIGNEADILRKIDESSAESTIAVE